MNVLLDTHVLVWSFFSSGKLSKYAAAVISDEKNSILVSSISLWEISIKFRLGKLTIGSATPEDVLQECRKLDFKIIPLQAHEAATYFQLPLKFHTDPFDRMLVWQAIQNRYQLISKDKNLVEYKQQGLLVSW